MGLNKGFLRKNAVSAALALLLVSGTSGAIAQERIAVILPMWDTHPKEIGEAAKRQAVSMGAEVDVISIPSYSSPEQVALIESAIASQRYDGILTNPYGPASVASLESAVEKGIKVATAHLPVNGEFSEPSAFEGQTVAVLVAIFNGGKARGEAVAEFCAEKDPCNIALILGDKAAGGFEKAMLDGEMVSWSQNPNIKIVSTQDAASRTGVAPYSIPAGREIAQDIVNAFPDLHALVITGDQMWQGAYDILVEEGLQDKILSYGGGSSLEGVIAIQEGRMAGSAPVLTAQFSGCSAMEYLIRGIRGEFQGTKLIDPLEEAGLPAMIGPENAATFSAQWSITGENVEEVCP